MVLSTLVSTGSADTSPVAGPPPIRLPVLSLSTIVPPPVSCVCPFRKLSVGVPPAAPSVMAPEFLRSSLMRSSAGPIWMAPALVLPSSRLFTRSTPRVMDSVPPCCTDSVFTSPLSCWNVATEPLLTIALPYSVRACPLSDTLTKARLKLPVSLNRPVGAVKFSGCAVSTDTFWNW